MAGQFRLQTGMGERKETIKLLQAFQFDDCHEITRPMDYAKDFDSRLAPVDKARSFFETGKL